MPAHCRVVRIRFGDGLVETIIGIGHEPTRDRGCGSDGDGGPALQASLEPDFITQDMRVDLFIVDGFPGGRIRRVDSEHALIVNPGSSQPWLPLPISSAQQPLLYMSMELFLFRRSGRRIVASSVWTCQQGRQPPLNISSFGGNKEFWAESTGEKRVFSDPLGNLYLLDAPHVYYIDLSKHFIFVVAGSTKGFGSDGGPATQAKMFWPTSLVFDSAGNLYIADSENQRVRRVDAKTHIITTVAGNGGPPHVPGTIELSQ